ncbi:MAG: serine--tRNA ligase, partial [Bacteroidota bacterium]
MLQVTYLRENTSHVIEALLKRNFKEAESAVHGVLKLYQDRRSLVQEVERKQSESNHLSRQIGLLVRDGDKAGAQRVKTQTADL